jgi:hypothetical protein
VAQARKPSPSQEPLENYVGMNLVIMPLVASLLFTAGCRECWGEPGWRQLLKAAWVKPCGLYFVRDRSGAQRHARGMTR